MAGAWIVLLELDIPGNTQRFSSVGVVGPSAYYSPYVISFGGISRAVPVRPGLPTVSNFSVTLSNNDLLFSQLLEVYTFRGVTARIKIGLEGTALSGFGVHYQGTIYSVSIENSICTIQIRDASYDKWSQNIPGKILASKFPNLPYDTETGELALKTTQANIVFGNVSSTTKVTGTHNGSTNNAAFLQDTGKNFINSGVTVGDLIQNLTDGSQGTITKIGSTTNANDSVWVTLAGGSDNDWDTGDAYLVATEGQGRIKCPLIDVVNHRYLVACHRMQGGPFSSHYQTNGAPNIGDTSINIESDGSATGHFHTGDVITFAGDTTFYVVGTITGGDTPTSIRIDPGLVVAVGNHALITQYDTGIDEVYVPAEFADIADPIVEYDDDGWTYLKFESDVESASFDYSVTCDGRGIESSVPAIQPGSKVLSGDGTGTLLTNPTAAMMQYLILSGANVADDYDVTSYNALIAAQNADGRVVSGIIDQEGWTHKQIIEQFMVGFSFQIFYNAAGKLKFADYRVETVALSDPEPANINDQDHVLKDTLAIFQNQDVINSTTLHYGWNSVDGLFTQEPQALENLTSKTNLGSTFSEDLPLYLVSDSVTANLAASNRMYYSDEDRYQVRFQIGAPQAPGTLDLCTNLLLTHFAGLSVERQTDPPKTTETTGDPPVTKTYGWVDELLRVSQLDYQLNGTPIITVVCLTMDPGENAYDFGTVPANVVFGTVTESAAGVITVTWTLPGTNDPTWVNVYYKKSTDRLSQKQFSGRVLASALTHSFTPEYDTSAAIDVYLVPEDEHGVIRELKWMIDATKDTVLAAAVTTLDSSTFTITPNADPAVGAYTLIDNEIVRVLGNSGATLTLYSEAGVRLTYEDTAPATHTNATAIGTIKPTVACGTLSVRTALSTPQNLTALFGETWITLGWNAYTDPNDIAMLRKYLVYRNTVNDFSSATCLNDSDTLTDNDYVDTGLTEPGADEDWTLYFYWVVGVNKSGVHSTNSAVNSAYGISPTFMMVPPVTGLAFTEEGAVMNAGTIQSKVGVVFTPPDATADPTGIWRKVHIMKSPQLVSGNTTASSQTVNAGAPNPNWVDVDALEGSGFIYLDPDETKVILAAVSEGASPNAPYFKIGSTDQYYTDASKVAGQESDVALANTGKLAQGFMVKTARADVTGTHTGSANNATLIDTTKNFVALGVNNGARVVNNTDGGSAIVTGVSTTTNANDTLNLGEISGGTDNDFDNGDSYTVHLGVGRFEIWLTLLGTLTANATLTAKVCIDSSGAPGSALTDGTSSAVKCTEVTADGGWVQFDFIGGVSLAANTQYWLVLEPAGTYAAEADGSNQIQWGVDATDPRYALGNWSVYAGSWTANTAIDGLFRACSYLYPRASLELTGKLAISVPVVQNFNVEIEPRTTNASESLANGPGGGVFFATLDTPSGISTNEISHYVLNYSEDIGFDASVTFNSNPTPLAGSVLHAEAYMPGKTYYWAIKCVLKNGQESEWTYLMDDAPINTQGGGHVRVPITAYKLAVKRTDQADDVGMILDTNNAVVGIDLRGITINTIGQTTTGARMMLNQNGLLAFNSTSTNNSTGKTILLDATDGSFMFGDINNDFGGGLLTYDSSSGVLLITNGTSSGEVPNAEITGGTVGGIEISPTYIQSASFRTSSGVDGFKIASNGIANFQDVIIRASGTPTDTSSGTIYAGSNTGDYATEQYGVFMNAKAIGGKRAATVNGYYPFVFVLAADTYAGDTVLPPLAAGDFILADDCKVAGVVATETSSDYFLKLMSGVLSIKAKINIKGTSTFDGAVTLTAGSSLSSGQTAYDTGSGFWIENTAGVSRISLGNSAGNKITYTTATGALTITGSVAITDGSMVGWTIAGTTLTGTNVVLDSAGTVKVGATTNTVGMTQGSGLWAGAASYATTDPFAVSVAGKLYANDVVIRAAGNFGVASGTIYAGDISGASAANDWYGTFMSDKGITGRRVVAGVDTKNPLVFLLGSNDFTNLGDTVWPTFKAGDFVVADDVFQAIIAGGGTSAAFLKMKFDGAGAATLSWKGALTSLTEAGVFTATDAHITGAITASSGTFTGNVTTTTGGLITGAESGARCVVNATGIAGYSGAATIAFLLATTAGHYTVGVTEYDLLVGDFVASQAKLTGATVSGAITATTLTTTGTGSIAGWSFDTTKLYNASSNIVLTSGTVDQANITVGAGSTAGGISAADASGEIIFWGGSSWANRADAGTPFKVTAGGVLTATGATITGQLNASTGTIGGTAGAWNITSQTIESAAADSTVVGMTTEGTATTSIRFYAGAANFADRANAEFRVTSGGTLYATDAHITGAITATSGAFTGAISGSTIATTTMTGGTIQTAASGARVVLDSNGLAIYDATTQRAKLGSDGSGWLGASNVISWTTAGAVSIAGFGTNSTGLSVASGGNTTIVSSGATAFTCGPTGAPTFYVTQAGVMTAVGATLKSATSGGRIEIDSAKIVGYDEDGTTVNFALAASAQTIDGYTINPGDIWARTGYIGTWVITSTGFTNTDASIVITSGNKGTSRIEAVGAAGIASGPLSSSILMWAGAAFGDRASAPFRVDGTGLVTCTSTIVGSISGNAGTVTNGVYTAGDQSISGVKTFNSTIQASISGNAATVTGGVYITLDQTISGIKTFSSQIVGSVSGSSGSCTGNAAGLSATLVLASGGTNANLTAVNGGLVYSTASSLAITAAGTSGYFVRSAGAAAPTFFDLFSTSNTWTTGQVIGGALASVSLNLSSAGGCLLVNRMSTTEAGLMPGGELLDGMIYYNTTANAFRFRQSSAWIGYASTSVANTWTAAQGFSASVTVSTGSADYNGLHVWGGSAQTSDIFKVQNFSGAADLFTVSPNGNLATGSATGTTAAVFEFGSLNAGNRDCAFDFHSSAGTDYNLRIARFSGVDGTGIISQTGTGALYIRTEEQYGSIIFDWGTSSPISRMMIWNSGVSIYSALSIGNPTGGLKGTGTINVETGIYLNNTGYSNPDFVLEHYFTGKIEKFIGNAGAADYDGLKPFSEVREFMSKNHHLPRIKRGPSDIFARGDMMLATMEEAMLYIGELEDRIVRLESSRQIQ